MKAFVTGVSGFVGGHLCNALRNAEIAILAASRSRNPILTQDIEYVTIGNFDGKTNWSAVLKGCDFVVHLAARVHVMHDQAQDPLEAFREANVVGTMYLARQAADAGVKRFVFVSSVKVNGEETIARPFTELDTPNPQDAYGISKYEAEQQLLALAQETGLEVVIVRPPLVYGAGVKANFAQMLSVLSKRIPLPFASVKNARSLIYVENLVDALILCATHPKAVGQTYLVSDGEDVSTPELLTQLSLGMGCPVRMFPVPVRLLEVAARLVGKGEQMKRLTGSLQVDCSKIRRELGWIPPFTLQRGLQKTAQYFGGRKI